MVPLCLCRHGDAATPTFEEVVGTEALPRLGVFHHVVGELVHVARRPERNGQTADRKITQTSSFTATMYDINEVQDLTLDVLIHTSVQRV